ncbi:exosome complex exonuclease Rrp41 [Candidatus Woesearchaeota archaeon CG_4_10_14_0_2_um_filter_33_10]|nr:MAG: exosome complex exonuclease Rrp41 [Candidatus Woesearchaeota archaeon CG1_02_33_12]PIN79329.1 MAG: exosome complex exonuclease Rrp41 [Candidatus Woesearchaeota archaeon CG10_big_fil_rev_8_21_14_0_10_33_12]PIU72986.1 MAG: exosome complex exonuclease Rrp41 [Candidatus Woesearchaeota archaeon CG06_land_8_20_14_3_00_33_13]PIZ53688.1 MAG: exosome complex exonuclease Rrp41 [Candidatus Woesearchaeota archaeon CG_4_10_14_0_2_um_filter_33_10]
MSYTKRNDGRKFDETRAIEAKAGVIKRADGSAYFKIGKTVAYAAVYGPREIHPKFLQNPKNGKLRCFYNMMPFSSIGERVRPGANRRAKEIAMVTEKALLPVVDISKSPNSVIDVFIELPQTDAGTRCAGICAASMALADAGISMNGMVAAVSIGRVDDKLVVDLDYSEESYEDGTVADIPIAVVSRTEEISLLQMDGELSRDDLKKAIEMAKKACSKIDKIQRDALKKKYEVKNG